MVCIGRHGFPIRIKINVEGLDGAIVTSKEFFGAFQPFLFFITGRQTEEEVTAHWRVLMIGEVDKLGH